MYCMKKVGFLHKPRLHYENSSGKKNLGKQNIAFWTTALFYNSIGCAEILP